MATFQCRVQYLDDTDPFSSTNFPEPTRPPTYTFLTNVPLINQIAGVKRLLKAPHKVSICCRDWYRTRLTVSSPLSASGSLLPVLDGLAVAWASRSALTRYWGNTYTRRFILATPRSPRPTCNSDLRRQARLLIAWQNVIIIMIGMIMMKPWRLFVCKHSREIILT